MAERPIQEAMAGLRQLQVTAVLDSGAWPPAEPAHFPTLFIISDWDPQFPGQPQGGIWMKGPNGNSFFLDLGSNISFADLRGS